MGTRPECASRSPLFQSSSEINVSFSGVHDSTDVEGKSDGGPGGIRTLGFEELRLSLACKASVLPLNYRPIAEGAPNNRSYLFQNN